MLTALLKARHFIQYYNRSYRNMVNEAIGRALTDIAGFYEINRLPIS